MKRQLKCIVSGSHFPGRGAPEALLRVVHTARSGPYRRRARHHGQPLPTRAGRSLPTTTGQGDNNLNMIIAFAGVCFGFRLCAWGTV